MKPKGFIIAKNTVMGGKLHFTEWEEIFSKYISNGDNLKCLRN